MTYLSCWFNGLLQFPDLCYIISWPATPKPVRQIKANILRFKMQEMLTVFLKFCLHHFFAITLKIKSWRLKLSVHCCRSVIHGLPLRHNAFIISETYNWRSWFVLQQVEDTWFRIRRSAVDLVLQRISTLYWS